MRANDHQIQIYTNVMLFTTVDYDFILAIDGWGAITYYVINNGDEGINIYSLMYDIKNI